VKIVITNVVALNAGDSAILHGVVRILREAFGDRARIVVLERDAAQSAAFYPTLDFRQAYVSTTDSSPGARLLRRLLGGRRALNLRRMIARRSSKRSGFLLPATARRNRREMLDADLVVSTGGTYLVEHYDFSDKLVQLFLAAGSGRPTVMFSQSLGPFRLEANIRDVRRLMPGVALLMLRDRKSLEHLREIGADTRRARVVADAAFALADEGRLLDAAARRTSKTPSVAVSVREWKFPGAESGEQATLNYYDSVRAAVTRAVRTHGAKVTFLSTCQGIPRYWTDDSRTAREIADGLPHDVRERVSVDTDHHGPDQLIERYARFDLVIATRMHAAILALSSGTPVLPIAYEFKTRELFEGMGFGDWVQDIAELTPAALADLVSRCLAEIPERRGALIAAVDEQRRSAREAIALVRAAAGGGELPSPA